jgi:hypothetical protein
VPDVAAAAAGARSSQLSSGASPDWNAVGDDEVLDRWLAEVREVLAAQTAKDEGDGAVLLALAVLDVLRLWENGPLQAGFWGAVRLTLQDLCDRTGNRFPFRTRRQYTDQPWGNELPGFLDLLAGFGMVTDPDGPGSGSAGSGSTGSDSTDAIPQLTELGRWALAASTGQADADRQWLAVEQAAQLLEAGKQDEALTELWEGLPGADLAEVLALIPGTGHPDADLVSKKVTVFIESGAPRSVDRALQLKMTLKGPGAGEQPGTWRTVLVPGIFTLGDLHEAIRAVFGWDGRVPHVFVTGQESYSGLDHVPGTSDETRARLGTILAGTPTFAYRYGLEPLWELEIALEESLPQEPGRFYPYCAAFGGGDPSAGDPVPFDLAAANRRLNDL